MHQHNAPFACLDTQRIVAAHAGLPHVVDPEFFEQCLSRARRAAADAMPRARRVTHVAGTSTRVEKVASNRRIARNAANQVIAMRGSATRDEALRAMPEGLIDPDAKTIAFYDGEQRIAALHYYATPPDELLRRRSREQRLLPAWPASGCRRPTPDARTSTSPAARGNVTAGKYNDGSKPMREVLTTRLHDALAAGLGNLRPEPITQVSWRSTDLLPLTNPTLDAATIVRQIANTADTVVNRNRPAYQLAWIERVESRLPIVISALRLNQLGILHLPAESFVEYQLAAQKMLPARVLATAAYGDGGPWYIPTTDEYDCGGYEVSVAFSDRAIDPALRAAIAHVLAG